MRQFHFKGSLGNQLGMSLSEVLISLFLSSLIFTLLMQFYLSSKRDYLKAEKILEQAFDIQWVSELLSDSIRRAGFTPCMSLEEFQLKDSQGKFIRSVEFSNTSLPLIAINRMDEHFSQVVRIRYPSQVEVDSTQRLNLKKTFLITDCINAELVSIYRVDYAKGRAVLTLDAPLHFSYTPETYIGEWIQEKWFVHRNSQGKFALFYSQEHPEELTLLVNAIKTEQQLIKGKKLITVLLGLSEGTTHSIKTLVRGW